MQIRRIYSNKPKIFSPINFNCEENAILPNIVYGEVRHPSDRRRDSHNLGKTTLLHLIDFLLLKATSPEHFLVRNRERFEDFVFFIELALRAGDFATVRRGASNPNRVAMTRHLDGGLELAEAHDDAWDHTDLSRDDALLLLDGWLDLTILKPYNFRKAITYFLRAQGDYGDELQLQKFSAGKDRDWKPFVAHLFGFNETPVFRKYELDENIAKIKSQLAERQAEVQFKEDQLPELTARLSVLQQQVDESDRALNAFEFDDEERRMMKELVESIEVEVATINERIYNIRYDINQIEAALSHKDKFDLREVERVFKESEINFPGQLKKSYEDLVNFNRQVTHERNLALRARQKSLAAEEAMLLERKRALDRERELKLRTLRDSDTFEKFKALQNNLARERAQIVYLEEQRKKLELVADLARQVREAERDRGRVVDEIKAMVARPSSLFERFTATFNSYCLRVLSHEGIFYFRVNSNDNFDYSIGLSLPGNVGVLSSQSEGTSYKKLICALFDLALLKVYETAPFFHFVYHDGLLEGLDDRKKIALLEVIREQTSTRRLQYIFSVIDSDTPRNAQGERLEFSPDEIVLRLHDDGIDGRLFKMAEF
jgi:uncharacterized protein YydD (DUF2326 family)